VFSEQQEVHLKRAGAWVVKAQHQRPASPQAAALYLGGGGEGGGFDVAERSGGPAVGAAAAHGASAGQEFAALKRARHAERGATEAWLRRVLSRLSGATLVRLRDTEARFGDAVTYKGQVYAGKLSA